MKQNNRHHSSFEPSSNKEVLRSILKYPLFYELPKHFNDMWESAPSDSDELDKRVKNSEEKLQDDATGKPYHFLRLMLSNSIYENTILKDVVIQNDEIDNRYQDTRIPKEAIQFTKIKIVLIQRHIRFILNALDTYKVMLEHYESLPKKNKITQEDIDNELIDTIILSKMNSSLKGDTKTDENVLDILKDTSNKQNKKTAYTYLANAKELGIPFKELRSAYPAYRSNFRDDGSFTHCVEIYSYYFFLNNFTYGTKEEAAKFSYSTVEYIKHIIHNTTYSPYINSYYRSLLDKIADTKDNLPYSLRYQDIIHCDISANDDSDSSMGFYFPKTNSTYSEKLPK